MKDRIILTSSACVFRKTNDDLEWFLVKQDTDDDWEFPKTLVKPAESSVRAALRTLGENAGMDAKVLDEIGRSGGATRHEGKISSQRLLYYLMLFKGGEEILGYVEAEWVPHSNALRRLTSKRESQMMKDGKKIIADLETARGKEYVGGRDKEKK